MAGFEKGGRPRNREQRYRRGAMQHPLRQRIARQMLNGRRIGAERVAAELDQPLGRILYHLRVLVRRRVLKAFARGPGALALYRWAPHAHWARKMLGEIDERSPEDG